MKNMTMQDRILDYMQKHNGITSWEAFRDLGCTRLSEYIRRIRLEREVKDKTVFTTNRYGEKVKFKRYFLGA